MGEWLERGEWLEPTSLSPLGERVARPGVFISRGGTGEGVFREQVEEETSIL